jgi:acyl dehydratase
MGHGAEWKAAIVVNWDRQRMWNEVSVGDELEPVSFPLSVYRLIVEAGANRDFNSIHHNSAVAKAAGAPDMYANAYFLQGMWERAAREFIGVHGTFLRVAGFRMHHFNPVGHAIVVRGRVVRVWRDGGLGLVDIEMTSENRDGVSVGPGVVTVALPGPDGAPSHARVRRWLAATEAERVPAPVPPVRRAETEPWVRDWAPVQDLVGSELGDTVVLYGADIVEPSGVRRFLEPLEFDCPLHTSAQRAREAGYADLVLPWSATIPFTIEAFWSPGEPPAFVGTSYDAQPARSPYAIHDPVPRAPVTSAFVASETSVMEFVAPVVVGDRVGRVGRRLVDCQPKRTRVGEGAFIRFGAEIRNQREEPVMRTVRQYFYYNPR